MTTIGETIKLYCTKDFYMRNGDKQFTKGKSYIAKRTSERWWELINDSERYHSLGLENIQENFSTEKPSKLPEFVEKLLKEEKEYLVGKLNNLQVKAERHRADLDTTQKDIDATIEKLKQVQEVLG